MTNTKQIDKQEEGVIFTQNTAWPWTGGRTGVPTIMQEVTREERVAQAVELYTNYVREAETRGDTVIISEANVVNDNIIRNWGQLVRTDLGQGVVDHGNYRAKTSQDIRMANEIDLYMIPKTKTRPNFGSLSTESSENGNVDGGDINQLADKSNGGSDGGGSPGDPGDSYSGVINRIGGGKQDGHDRPRREFLLVKPLNINVKVFTGFNLSNNFHIPFNKSLRKLILTQGHDEEELLKILDHVESHGDTKFTHANLRALSDIYPKSYEYARAVNAALFNWTEDVAQGMVEHGCDNGLGAWRRVYHQYIPGAEDLQHLQLEELMSLKPLNHNEIDSLFTEIERIMEWYIKADADGESMNNKWVRAAFIENLPKNITQHLATPLRKADTVDAVYNLVVIHMHDHSTGLPRHQAFAKLYFKASNDKEQYDAQKEKAEHNTEVSPLHGDFNAVPNGRNNGKSTGYGAR